MTQSSSSVSFLLLSGGIGQRSGHSEPKQFYELHGHPVIAYSIIAAIQVPEIAEIIVNSPPGYEERTAQIMRSYCANRPFRIVAPGATRQESCRLLTEAAEHERVILHEAARPFINKTMLRTLLDCGFENAGYCLPIPFSMCQIDPDSNRITAGVSRKSVFNIQLPQVFRRDTLREAHAAALTSGQVFTEDAVMCVETVGAQVMSLQGHSQNFKITTQEDFVIAEHLMEKIEK